MKKQDMYKLLALLMILTMIIVPAAYVITSPRSDLSEETQEQQSSQEKYNPELWSVNQPFNSISDALSMTPYDVVTAQYVDLEGMTPQMIQWVRQDLSIIREVDSIYKSNTTRMYYAKLQEENNESFLLLSTMSPEKNDFEYIVSPNTYFNHYILIRQEPQFRGLINVMGNPAVLGPPQAAVEVLKIITSLNKTATAYDRYEGLLGKVDPAPLQIINSTVDFADRYYMGIREINGSYERTTAYVNISSGTLKKINQLKTASSQKGFEQYNITRSGNYTIVKIVAPDLLKVLTEESY